MPLVWTSLVAQTVKRLSTMQETWVQSLGWADPLEKEMAAHFIILVWKIPWTKEPGRLLSMRLQRVRHDWLTSLFMSLVLFQIKCFFQEGSSGLFSYLPFHLSLIVSCGILSTRHNLQTLSSYPIYLQIKKKSYSNHSLTK